MNRSRVKLLIKSGSDKVFTLLILTLSLLIMVSCGGGSSSTGSNNDTNDPPAPPAPALGVTINSIEMDDCPNLKVYLSVADENSQLIENDPDLAVQLYEDGVEQTNNFSIAWQGNIAVPITVVIAMDYSLSMTDSIPDMEAGVKAFIDNMKPTDRVAIIKFYYQPQLMIGLSSDKAALYNAVDQAPDNRDFTNIYDTVVDAVDVVAGGEGRVAVILLTDGEHLVSSDFTVINSLQQAIDHAKAQDVSVYSIGLDLRVDSEIEFISDETGGIYYPILDSSVISDIYLSLFELLEKQHMIIYATGATDGLEHSIQLFAQHNGVSGESILQNFTSCMAP